MTKPAETTARSTATVERRIPAAKIQFLPEDRIWIAERIQEVLESGQLTLGKYGAEFERRFASLCGSTHGIAVNSGTSAIEIILRALGVEGRDVIVPTNTFFATAAALRNERRPSLPKRSGCRSTRDKPATPSAMPR